MNLYLYKAHMREIEGLNVVFVSTKQLTLDENKSNIYELLRKSCKECFDVNIGRCSIVLEEVTNLEQLQKEPWGDWVDGIVYNYDLPQSIELSARDIFTGMVKYVWENESKINALLEYKKSLNKE